MRKKIALVGAGNIGGTLAHIIGLKEIADVALIDVVEGIPKGKALDLSQSSSIESFNIQFKGSANFKDMNNSDVVIVTAGFPRRPGMSRDDLVEKNSKIIHNIDNIKDQSIDVITCLHVIEHINDNDLINIFNSFRRIIKSNGKVIFSTPAKNGFSQRIKKNN